MERKIKAGHIGTGVGAVGLIGILMSWSWFMNDFPPHSKALAANVLAKQNKQVSEKALGIAEKNYGEIIGLKKDFENVDHALTTQTAAFNGLIQRMDRDRTRELERLRRRGEND